jgi:hypothetical protein
MALPLALLLLRHRMRSLDPFWTVILPPPDQFPANCASGPSAAREVCVPKARRLEVTASAAKLRAFMIAQTRGS